jgi:hypothetical protein
MTKGQNFLFSIPKAQKPVLIQAFLLQSAAGYNRVDLQHFNIGRVKSTTFELWQSLGIEPDRLILGNIARLTEQKGQDILL